ncbi:hypothetical protein AJ80_08577 [Polytolypa hystricis UAMH7299]|uniref:MI domain-containing protein n=1 Tax=Polytolypa hystricis (strain UAMH7299) TaxID=1447883 RepID=A0A2B7X596_POLH7|nr:hypothetical protein AJ80_08577 [Polytolypa hystricis UAMH7299]
MGRPKYNTTLLPKALRDELGIDDGAGSKGGWNGGMSRKDKRKSEREQKRGQQRQGQGQRHGRRGVRDVDSDDDGDSAGEEVVRRERRRVEKKGSGEVKSILRRQQVQEPEDSLSEDEEDAFDLNESTDDEEEEVSQTRKPSKGVQDKLDQDDVEIARLEKALGMKGKSGTKKLPKSFHDDGLADLLGDVGGSEGEDEGRKRKREGDEWLRSKRMKALGRGGDDKEEQEESESGSEDGLDGLDEELEGDFDNEDEDEDEDEDDEDLGEDSGFEGFDNEPDEPPPPRKTRENPYIAPAATPSTTTTKYIPPSLRAPSSAETESLTRLRRQTQGHLNKLSETNLLSILSDIEKLYRDYPRQNVTTTLIELLFGLVFDKSVLQDTFLILHAGFIAALYRVMGMDFGAELVQRLVERYDEVYERTAKGKGSDADANDAGQRKELVNVISLLSQLYNFHVIGSSLVFDYIRLFLKEINELNTELLLKIIRNSGPQLRTDDPSSLKDIVLLIQPAVAAAGDLSTFSVRTKFMIDTITDLKNNRMRTGLAASTVSSEHLTRMRKVLGSLNARGTTTVRATEPLRISRADIHNSAKKGKWWLVGASWKEDAPSGSNAGENNAASNINTSAVLRDSLDDVVGGDEDVDLVQLARSHRMNTDVRRSIFIAIMSASDFRDAHVRLTKLRLKRAQEGEIPRVLIHCASEEEAHNPYYTLIARRLCSERRMQKAFMFALWDVFKRLGEKGDMDDDDDDDFGDSGDNALGMKVIVNLAKMFGSLVADGVLNVGIFRTLDFVYLQPKTRTFVELLVVTVILQTQQKKMMKEGTKEKKKAAVSEEELDEKPLVDVFMRARETPQVTRGLIYFIRKVVSKSDVVASKREKVVVKWGCKVAVDTLRIVAAEGGNATAS